MELLSRMLVFRSPRELILGAMLLYCFRTLERRAGSSKYACFVAFTTGFSLALQAALSKWERLPAMATMPSGPYGLLFASFVLFFCDIPATTHFGWRFTNKAGVEEGFRGALFLLNWLLEPDWLLTLVCALPCTVCRASSIWLGCSF